MSSTVHRPESLVGRRLALAVGCLLVSAPLTVRAQDLATGASQSHTVTRGDTLWDLARRYLGDPFLWPEIYKRNTDVVEDPHWIYPGEVLTIAGGAAKPAVPQTDTPTSGAPSSASGDVAMAGGTPTDADDADTTDSDAPLFPRIGGTVTGSVIHYTPRSYRALRPSEFYSSGFLTENEKLETGIFLGPVTPPQIASVGRTATSGMYMTVAIDPTSGKRPEVGDSLLVFYYGKDVRGHGKVVMPTGLVRITSVEGGRTLGRVVALYGPMRGGQMVMPAEHFADGGTKHAVPIADGIAAKVLEWPGYMELKDPLDVIFLDKGSRDGVKPGDIFELRRTPAEGRQGMGQAPELLGVVTVVRAGEVTSTARIARVIVPKIDVGTAARQIARLPA